VSGPDRLPDWTTLGAAVPGVTATMRRYLDQLACVLRPGSVGGADLALLSLAAFLADHAPDVAAVSQVNRRHIEDFIRWLAARPGHNSARVTPATLAHRLGTLRMFFVRTAVHPPSRSREPRLHDRSLYGFRGWTWVRAPWQTG
jgi:hypothetical protein